MDGLPQGCVLKERYRLVLAQRAAGKTWGQIGALLGVSPSRAWQLAAEVRTGLRRTYDTAEEQERAWRWRLEQAAASEMPEARGFDLGPLPEWDEGDTRDRG